MKTTHNEFLEITAQHVVLLVLLVETQAKDKTNGGDHT